MTEKSTPGKTPTVNRDLILRPGDVVAVGLHHKKCPVGVVTAADSNGFRLDLYSWPIGEFSAGVKVVLWSQVVEVAPLARQRADGVFEMDPLAAFQTAWVAEAAVAAAMPLLDAGPTHPAQRLPEPKGYVCPACQHGTVVHREAGCDVRRCDCHLPFGRIMPGDPDPAEEVQR